MAPGPQAPPTGKPTFAKIVAKAVAPTNTIPNNTPNGKSSNEAVQTKTVLNAPASSMTPPKSVAQKSPPNGSVGGKTPVIITKRATPQPGQNASQRPQVQINAKSAGESGPSEISAKTPTDDGSTHVSSSESSVKMPSFDKQSVTSGTTFALDEKESLRPDDSASIRAIEEDDGLGSGATGSRVGSETDARAFSDQLNIIAKAGNMPPRAILQPNQRRPIQFGSLPSDPVEEPQVAPVHDAPVVVQPTPDAPPIDEKLMDALSSPRDRVFILKIEQDVLDFIKNEKDIHLTLPDCNSFYRMLAHRLADYYGLEHTHHPRDSGTAVLISKTGHTRLPPPLSGFTVERESNSPPPATRAARKIMRRGDEKGTSGASTTANSEGASKATSEAGDGSEIGKPKDKSAMTREEREAMYNEARLRIFGTDDPESQEGKKSGDENDHSRSSSASGKKKTKKRRDDDDFEPRSQFPGYYQQSLMNNGYSDGSFYFPQYPGVMTAAPQFTMPQTASPPPTMYSNGYAPVDVPAQMQYLTPQQYGSPPPNAMNGPNYVQQQTGNYDLSSQFQQMSFTNPSPNPMAPKSHSPNFAATQHMQTQQGWQPNYDPSTYMYGQPSFASQFPDRSMSSPAQGQHGIPYAFGQLPTAVIQNGKSMHPVPGSFNRQPQFNPQTQAFIPGSVGGRPGSMPMSAPQGNSPYHNPFGMPQNPMQQYRPNPQGQHRATPPTSNTSAFSSPAGGHVHVQAHNISMPMNYPPLNHAPPHSAPPGTVNRAPQVDSRPLAHPLPQLPNPESSIAKWGTPSHLPPKPPTPTDPHPHKFIDINKGLPARAPITGLPRNFIGSPPQ